MKKTLHRITNAAYYIAVAVLAGLVINGAGILLSTVSNFALEYGGVYLSLTECLVLGVIVVSLYQTYKERRAREEEIINFAKSYSRPDRPGYIPTAGEFDAFLKTPAGVDALYNVIKNKGRKPLASAAKLKTTTAQPAPTTKQEPVGVM